MVRHTRYPGGRDYLPEAFKQEAASSTEYPHRENTPEEQIAMYIRMYVDRKISYESMYQGIAPLYESHASTELRRILSLTRTKGNEEWIKDQLRPLAGRVYHETTQNPRARGAS